MQALRRALIATAAVVGSTLPAAAQTTTAAPDTSLIYVWVWILVAGIIFMVVGTSIVGSQK